MSNYPAGEFIYTQHALSMVGVAALQDQAGRGFLGCLFARATEGFAVVTPQHVLFYNSAFARLFYVEANAEYTAALGARILPTDITLFNSLINGILPDSPAELRLANGPETEWRSVTATSVDFFGNTATLLQVRDITTLKQTHQQLLEMANKAEYTDWLKTMFLTNLSYDIRTPINSILGFTALLNKRDLTPEKRKNYLDLIQNSSAQLLGVMNNLVDISQIENGKTELHITEVNIVEFLKKTEHLFAAQAKQKGITLNINLPPKEVINMQADELKLHQIFDTLLTNALQHTTQGSVTVNCQLKNQLLYFSVSDTGQGIPAETHNKIFDIYRQFEARKKPEYANIGYSLIISRAYVELMGGKISLASQAGVGTEVTFTLPYTPSTVKAPGPAKTETTTPLDFNGAKLLIAEDENSNFYYLQELLEELNVTIIRAFNGREAIEHCQDTPDIALVLMDINMPEVNGLQAVKQIRLIRPHLPIIAVTAYAYETDKQMAIDSGCNHYITKPVEPISLVEAIRMFIR